MIFQVLLEKTINILPPSTIKNTKDSSHDLKYTYSFVKLNLSEILFKTEFEKNIFDIKIKKTIDYLMESRPFFIKFILYYIPYVIKP